RTPSCRAETDYPGQALRLIDPNIVEDRFAGGRARRVGRNSGHADTRTARNLTVRGRPLLAVDLEGELVARDAEGELVRPLNNRDASVVHGDILSAIKATNPPRLRTSVPVAPKPVKRPHSNGTTPHRKTTATATIRWPERRLNGNIRQAGVNDRTIQVPSAARINDGPPRLDTEPVSLPRETIRGCPQVAILSVRPVELVRRDKGPGILGQWPRRSRRAGRVPRDNDTPKHQIHTLSSAT